MILQRKAAVPAPSCSCLMRLLMPLPRMKVPVLSVAVSAKFLNVSMFQDFSSEVGGRQRATNNGEAEMKEKGVGHKWLNLLYLYT